MVTNREGEMDDVYASVQHAIALAAEGDLDTARSAIAHLRDPIAIHLRTVFDRADVYERRTSEFSRIRHDVANELMIALASVEAMLDGVVDISPDRLDRLRLILVSVGDTFKS